MRSSRLIHTVDTQTEGIPTRVLTGGVQVVPGATMGQRSTWTKHLDDLRGLLMRKPHGHAAMSGAILQPPTTPDTDWAVLYPEITDFLYICGHSTIGVTTALVEKGMVDVTEPVTHIRLHTPAGLVTTAIEVVNGRAVSVSITNVPAFVLEDDAIVDVEGIGEVRQAMVFGGNFYPVIDARQLGLELDLRHQNELIDVGGRIIDSVNAQRLPTRPEDGIQGIYHAEFVQPDTDEAETRNAVLNVLGYFDRSPCGTGTSAIMALRQFRAELHVGDRHVNESMLEGPRPRGTHDDLGHPRDGLRARPLTRCSSWTAVTSSSARPRRTSCSIRSRRAQRPSSHESSELHHRSPPDFDHGQTASTCRNN